MKVAYFGESPADRAALRIFTEAILRRPTEQVPHAGLEHRGWPAVKGPLPAILKQLHYHTDADGFVFVVDSNGDPPHLPAHESAPEPRCRLCRLRGIAAETMAKVRPRAHMEPLKIALGLAVPAIEAWLLCGLDPHVSEAAWITGLKEPPGRMPYSKGGLKRQLYGSSYASLPVMTEAMKTAAERLAHDLTTLERLFPAGFGALANALRNW